MSYYILLCDTDWKIKKVLEQGSTAPIEAGSCLTDFFKEPEKLEKAVSEGMENGSVKRPMKKESQKHRL